MVEIYLDQSKIKVDEDILLTFLEAHDFNEAWVPRSFWKNIRVIMKKKGFVVERVVNIGGQLYDVWKAVV